MRKIDIFIFDGGTKLAANVVVTFSKSSPVPGRMRRQPGQSLREEFDRLCEDRLMPSLFVPLVFWLVWFVEWIQKKGGQLPDPRFWLGFAILITLISGAGIFRLRPRMQNLRLGEKGERKVADILDQLRAKGFVPFHDLPGDGFNVDHVVVGPTGVYAIETKTRSGFGTIAYRDKGELVFGGRISDSRPVLQARASARTVRAHLQEHLRETYGVKPVVVFVGKWKVKREAGDFDVDVMTADRLEKYFEHQQPELTSRQIDKIASHLERFARS